MYKQKVFQFWQKSKKKNRVMLQIVSKWEILQAASKNI